eukprot:1430638-Amphidinium_carterae.1
MVVSHVCRVASLCSSCAAREPFEFRGGLLTCVSDGCLSLCRVASLRFRCFAFVASLCDQGVMWLRMCAEWRHNTVTSQAFPSES